MMDDNGASPDDFDDDYVDEPFTDPAIKAGYRDAFARFIMAHNEVHFG